MQIRMSPRRPAAATLLTLILGSAPAWSAVTGTPGADSTGTDDCRFPVHAHILDVTRDPYNARGDGITDDTAALQRALDDATGTRRLMYLPAGTYLVSESLTLSKKGPDGRENWGFTFIRGESASRTIIRLRDGTFEEAGEDGTAILSSAGFGSADWFHNYVENLTFDVGRGNPGAVGLRFYANNSGAVRHVRVVSQDGAGTIGLDLAADMNGPLLVKDVEVVGFRRGIRTGATVNSQTFEGVTLRGQGEVGLINQGQSIALRHLYSDNAVPAIINHGHLAVLDCVLEGSGSAAIVHDGGDLLVRDVTTSGYARAVADTRGGGVAGSNVDEYHSNATTTLFPSPEVSMRLPIEETPDLPWDAPGQWAVVDDFGADPTAGADSSDAIQRAIDSGATTVFLPGSYALTKPIILRGKVRRMMGIGGSIDYAEQSRVDIIVADGEAPVVAIEHFEGINGEVEIDTQRTVLLRSFAVGGESRLVVRQPGKLFIEDVAGGWYGHDLGDRAVWARQFNVENEGTHLINDGGSLWILGYKTERGGTLVETRGGGTTEIFGTFSYTTTAGGLAPMFVNHESSVFVFFNEVNYNGDPYQVLVSETRDGETRTLTPDQGHVSPYSGRREKAIPPPPPDDGGTRSQRQIDIATAGSEPVQLTLEGDSSAGGITGDGQSVTFDGLDPKSIYRFLFLLGSAASGDG